MTHLFVTNFIEFLCVLSLPVIVIVAVGSIDVFMQLANNELTPKLIKYSIIIPGTIALVLLHFKLPLIFKNISYTSFAMSIMFLRLTVKNLLVENDNASTVFKTFKRLPIKSFFTISRLAVISEAQDLYPQIKSKYPYMTAIPANPNEFSIHDEQLCNIAMHHSQSMNHHDRMAAAGKAAVWGNLTLAMATLTLWFTVAAAIDDLDIQWVKELLHFILKIFTR